MKALVFAHFSKTDSLSPGVLRAIETYARHVDVIAFVSTSTLPTDAHDSLSRVCKQIIVRNNIGYDFMSWKIGLEAIRPYDHFQEIILTNDSIIGPLADPTSLFERLSADPRDICGLTLSWEFGRHIQSYFVRYKSGPLRSRAFDAFWNDIAPNSEKQEIIQRYEVALTAFMEKHGHTVGALYEPRRDFSTPQRLSIWAANLRLNTLGSALRSLRRTLQTPSLNPTLYLWRETLKADLPFVKKELVRDNPTDQNLSLLFNELQMRFGIDATIVRHLARQ
ncbi:rhamnan synthesis F family protein [Nitratireductor sp. XY-223]|uniref:rhamnan synthesis F family protein n=1 Tax=Nitratireductor sp. XY-223 TaxID=2561926 RepID=UPI0010AA3354|nr:rhamnan synthesis F family protein [Nitratireductor sp. XY-223]